MYDIIYDYILNNIFNSTYLSNYHMSVMNVDTNLNVYLSHALTIVIMIGFILALWWFTKWLFKLIHVHHHKEY